MSLICLILWGQLAFQPEGSFRPSELAHTYSIVAVDPETGQMGGAVQSHWFSVGSSVLWAEPGVGVVATQSLTRIDYGPLGLAKMAAGTSPAEALKGLVAADPGEALRQVAMVRHDGSVAAHTGKNCIAQVCDQQAAGVSVQANLMLKSTVCAAMLKAYHATKGSLADRLTAALAAAQAEGGDLRGQQSAAMVIVDLKKPERAWEGRVLDLRVEDHPDPVAELKRLVAVHQAYQRMNESDHALEKGETERALALLKEAVAALPGRLEPRFWQAFNLIKLGKQEEGLAIWRDIMVQDANWKVLPERLMNSGLMDHDPELLKKIATF
ncbi:DUF1028 domain-containing protein [Acanthopleuribacter pedis]|uniref:DUF1028 domain-containing protein n=1 Tax=Acanthopleuribacter pedis TaxID=442870 RepID=A0A8J7U5K5_9BACT|nr:DUF1028 domain-containing protein [Acanthopleuribacter pedis]MBO1320548.1 DUF1028 domain-containing protein [Acanthopleuribacter pedis]